MKDVKKSCKNIYPARNKNRKYISCIFLSIAFLHGLFVTFQRFQVSFKFCNFFVVPVLVPHEGSTQNNGYVVFK
jgi:hypothetical protein